MKVQKGRQKSREVHRKAGVASAGEVHWGLASKVVFYKSSTAERSLKEHSTAISFCTTSYI